MAYCRLSTAWRTHIRYREREFVKDCVAPPPPDIPERRGTPAQD
jgi:hypothetical protein